MRRLYWCRCAGGRNFGDVLGVALARHFGIGHVEVEKAADADLVIVGSIAEHVPERWAGTIAGIGCAHASTRPDWSAADVRAVRGDLTRRAAGLPLDVVLGDPGLLAPDLVPGLDLDAEPEYDVGVICHYADRDGQAIADQVGHRIDVRAPVDMVIRQAAACARIITSSLHGLILADALGRPRRWMTYRRVQGGGHKFLDYASSIGQLRSIEPGRWMTAPRARVEAIQAELREVLGCLG